MSRQDALLHCLIESLRLVALEPDEQIAALPDFVHVPDEIALEFYERILLLPELEVVINQAVRAKLIELDSLFEDMSRPSHASFWTIDALRRDERWSRARALAREALAMLGKSPDRPKLDWITYVPGRAKNDVPSRSQGDVKNWAKRVATSFLRGLRSLRKSFK